MKHCFLVASICLISSCSYQIPNVQVCADKGALGAHCAYTRNGPSQNIRKFDWDRQRVGWFCMDAANYGKYQKFVSDVCANDQNCVDEADAFVAKVKGQD